MLWIPGISADAYFPNKLSCSVLNVNISITPVVFTTERQIKSFQLIKKIRQGMESKKDKLQESILNMINADLNYFEDGIKGGIPEELSNEVKSQNLFHSVEKDTGLSPRWDQNKGEKSKIPLEFLNLHAEHSATIHCSGVDNATERIQQIHNLFGPGYKVLEEQLGKRPQEASVNLEKQQLNSQYRIKWNVTNFKSSTLNVNTLINYTIQYKHLPIYMYLIGGSKVKDIQVNMFYIYDYLLFKEGSSEDNIQLWYNNTKWQYMLHAPYLEPYLMYSVAYRLTVTDQAADNHCETTYPVGLANTLQINCQNHEEDEMKMGQSTKVHLYTFGDKSNVPSVLFQSLLSYSKLCSSNALLNGKFVCGMVKYIDMILLVYISIVIFMQMQALLYPHNERLRTQVAIFNMLAYLCLYCPGVIMTTDFKQLCASLYIFYLEGFKQDFVTHNALALAWVVYPGFMFVIGLLPAILFISDLIKYGHFHSCFTPRNCKKTENGDYDCQLVNTDSAARNMTGSTAEDKACDEQSENRTISDKQPLTDESTPGEPTVNSIQMGVPNNDSVAMTAMCDVLRLFHWSVVLYCLPWLGYYIIVGLYPPYHGVQLILCVIGVEMIYWLYYILRFKRII